MINGETIEQWLDNLIRDAKFQGITDDTLAYILLRRGLGHYLKSVMKCETCPLKYPSK